MTNSRLPLEQIKRESLIKRDLTEADYDQLKKDVGERIKIALDTDSYSKIAELLEIPSVSNVKTYVDGLRFPSAEVLVRFKARGFSIDWLLTGEGSKWAKLTEVFSEEDEQRIMSLARKNGINFWEQINKLTRAGLGFLDEVDDWKSK